MFFAPDTVLLLLFSSLFYGGYEFGSSLSLALPQAHEHSHHLAQSTLRPALVQSLQNFARDWSYAVLFVPCEMIKIAESVQTGQTELVSLLAGAKETKYNRVKGGDKMEITVESLPQGVWFHEAYLRAADYVGDVFKNLGETLIHLNLRLTRMGDEVLADGMASMPGKLQCARCLEEFSMILEGSFETLYVPERCSLPTDPAQRDKVEFYAGKSIDITDDIREAVCSAIPMKALCRSDCKGLCPYCGQNLNEWQCKCQKQEYPVSNPFAQFFQKRKT